MADELKIVRFLRRDLSGDLPVERALRDVKGINFAMARAIRIKSGIDKNIKFGDLDEKQISLLTKIIESPHKFDFPTWILNRRKDWSSGIDTHIVESSLDMTLREDLQRMKKMKSYRGIRHMFGLKVRGQRTRSTGRKGTTIGVVRKKGAPASKGN